MNTVKQNRRQIQFVLQGAVIAALYVALTELSTLVGMSSGVIQVRISEALCVLAVFTPAAIPGLTLGCMISNLLVPGVVWADIVFGSFATLIGATLAYLFRRFPFWIAPIPTILANALIIPFVLAYAYGVEDAIWFMMLTVGAGEVIAAGILGILLYFAIRRIAPKLFMDLYCGPELKKKDKEPKADSSGDNDPNSAG